jgi:hypothetical protein
MKPLANYFFNPMGTGIQFEKLWSLSVISLRETDGDLFKPLVFRILLINYVNLLHF